MTRSTKQYAKMKVGSPDDFQTDPVALSYLIPFIPQGWRIWECAAGNGNLVNEFQKHRYFVTGTDIKFSRDEDFLLMDAGRISFDCIVTNPPFSLKEEFLQRCYALRKPFALLLPITTFDSVERRRLMCKHGIEIIFPPKRINFETPNHEKNRAAGKKTSTWFYSAWFTNGLNMGRQLTFLGT